jgi:hypothetical protein
MEQDTKESGMIRLIDVMERDTKYGQMVVYMRDIGEMIKLMVEVV